MKFAIWGGGRLGKATAQYLSEQNEEFYIKNRNDAAPQTADVVIDFSSPDATDEVLSYALQNKIPLVIGVTGHSRSQRQKIALASKEIPVAYDSNFSGGIFAVKKILTYAKSLLLDWECGIIEYHRKEKADSPSGTALTLNKIVKADSVTSVRIGEEAGTHEIVFWGRGEKITVSHTAVSIDPFVIGAVDAAKKIAHMPAGIYTMKDFFMHR